MRRPIGLQRGVAGAPARQPFKLSAPSWISSSCCEPSKARRCSGAPSSAVLSPPVRRKRTHVPSRRARPLDFFFRWDSESEPWCVGGLLQRQDGCLHREDLQGFAANVWRSDPLRLDVPAPPLPAGHAPPAKVPVPDSGRLIGMEEVRTHRSKEDCWVVLNDEIWE